MAHRHQLFSYALQPSYAAASAVSPAPPAPQPQPQLQPQPKIGLSSLYGSSAADHYFPDTNFRFLPRDGSEALSNYSSSLGTLTSSSAMYHHLPNTTTTHLAYPQLIQQHQEAWPPGVEVPVAASAVEPLPPGVKRTSEALYYPTLLGAHNTIGQTEAWYTTDYFTKRLKLESTSHLPVYPQRPGEKDCTHYMQTRTCKFGESCKFDHPIWVPEGGIPDWKEAPLVPNDDYPERPGEPDCPYYIKTQRCKYGLRCKFNHPRAAAAVSVENQDSLPERPSEPPCTFYMKTGKCKFGLTCKFHHPKDIQLPSSSQEMGTSEALTSDPDATNNPHVTFTAALYHNSKGLPVRPGEVDCPFYLKTGSCKYGATCRYNHPERTAFTPQAAGINYPLVSSTAASVNLGLVNSAASLYQTLAQPTLGALSAIYPQRPGQSECDYYMKTGECKFGERCRFHHPADRLNATTKQASQQPNVKLSLAGYPRREGALNCPYYMKTGTCKYGATCKFDHPAPGEVMAKTSSEADAGGGADTNQ
ncbi:hypothetical protein EUTSA_v10020494mg [Eutrema salsugineum]|uniref:C3H1-type domain-containing protein n=1 Tax=Eutrema salsugineum TaxID=72664 RepID=V4M1Q9_EUTSA|nr:zinc finger CCCH domain-containing protein 37 isoform X2 [Eutrema salsugineum]ESQ48762.1 hypothetical protein EUTSA_v10020494mg [Eutrema salsugineum]